MNKSDFGIVYIATGKSYLQEAHLNASLSKLFCNQIPIVVYTDLIDDVDLSIFSSKYYLANPTYSYRDKIQPLINPPFKHTLFLDTDARLIFPPDDMFLLSTTYDLSAAPAPVRIPPGWVDPEVPPCFHEFNTGVLLIKKITQLTLLFLIGSIYMIKLIRCMVRFGIRHRSVQFYINTLSKKNFSLALFLLNVI